MTSGSGVEAVGLTSARHSRATARLLLLLIAVTVAGLYVCASSRVYRAERWGDDLTPENLKMASRLEPSNAEFVYKLGRYFLLVQNFSDSIANLQSAISLNPYDARYWLDLAGADLATDNMAGAQQALAHAVSTDPTTPEVLWQTANFELVQGDTATAVHRFHDLVEHDQQSLSEVLNVCWRATRDPNLIAENVLPANPAAYFTFIRFLANKNQPDAARDAWAHLIALKQPFPVFQAFTYLDYLISRGQFTEASEAWAQLASVNPEFHEYVPEGNLIVNGSFEFDLLNGGLDWRYSPKAGASVIVDDHRAHSGNRSLEITFDGAPDDSGVMQFVPLRANTQYRFSGFLMAEDLETVSPPRFSLLGLHRQYLLTSGVSGSTGWQELDGEFTTGNEDDLLLLRIVRVPGQRLIRGKLWVDDLKLSPTAANRTPE